MSIEKKPHEYVVWRHSMIFWGILLTGIMSIVVMSFNGLSEMVRVWGVREEYGYGYLIPIITLFMIWQRKGTYEKSEFEGAWTGVIIVLLGMSMVLLGNLTTIKTITQYGALFTVIGLVYSYTGKGIKPILVPLLFLLFMIPLPGFLLNNLSSKLQLISSEIGVGVIRLFDISVYLEGNVIDLGTYQLQVVEACSGLNYLFPLMSLAFIAAYFFKAPMWQRVTLFITSIPITVLMNSFRIGVIGVLVDKWGIDQAEGFLHYFEGWVIFMACMLILLGEMWLFTKFSNKKTSLLEVFGIDLPEQTPENANIRNRSIQTPLIVSVVFILVGAFASGLVEARQEIIPERARFSDFPLTIAEWRGSKERLDKSVLDVLKLDDYFIANYMHANGDTVNFYSAYYASQRGGASAHSPRSCIPGGGWQIKDFKTINLNSEEVALETMKVNRLLIKKGDHGQLVYYWFQQRDRIITNEYLVKWYLFWDALTKNRTDGALVRLTTSVKPGEDLDLADQRLIAFAKQVQPLMDQYIPR